MLLVAITLVSTFGMVAMAEEPAINIVIDGVKDADYTDAKMITYDYWEFYMEPDGMVVADPVDPERIKNTVWFNWDDEFVYLYVLVESSVELYRPQETAPAGYNQPSYYPTGEEEWKRSDCEYVRVFLDTAPSLGFESPCRWYGVNEGQAEFCDHFACAASDKSQTNDYRLMARSYPAWGFWDDFYTANEGVFMDYEGWRSRRLDPNSKHYRPQYGEGDEALAQATYAQNGGGNGQVASFIDYESQTYGVELKFRRDPNEKYFQFNVITNAKYYEWEDDGPELGYLLSFGDKTYLNSEDMLEIYFADYDETLPPAVDPVIRHWDALPAVDQLKLEDKEELLAAYQEYTGLSQELRAILDQERPELAGYFVDALAKMEKLVYVANLGDVNVDELINANDALLALRYSVGKIQLDADRVARADVNGDGKVDAKDALEMLQFTVGKRPEFSVVKTLEL